MSNEQRMALLARIERWTEWPETLLALALIPILLAPHLFSLSTGTRARLDDLDYLIWGVFAADLLLCLAIAPRRWPYLRSHWFDVIIVALPMLRPLRTLRVFRALRALAAADRVLVGVRHLVVRHGLHYVLATAFITILVAGSFVTAFERDAPGATIHSLPDGLWWALTTVTTVGYGDTYPTTALGRGIGVALMLVGIALFGAVTANLAAFFVDQRDNELIEEVRVLNERLARLEGLLTRESEERQQGTG